LAPRVLFAAGFASHRASSAVLVSPSGNAARTNASTFALVSSRRAVAVYDHRTPRQSFVARVFVFAPIAKRFKVANAFSRLSHDFTHLSQRPRDESRLALFIHALFHVSDASHELRIVRTHHRGSVKSLGKRFEIVVVIH
tara:strand:- start:3710 stop:4129 length:420 start_codon:yes stop_codon:yes gene_type:complete